MVGGDGMKDGKYLNGGHVFRGMGVGFGHCDICHQMQTVWYYYQAHAFGSLCLDHAAEHEQPCRRCQWEIVTYA